MTAGAPTKYKISTRPGLIRAVVYTVRRPGEWPVTWTCMSLPEAFERVEQDIKERSRPHLLHDLDVYTPNVPQRPVPGILGYLPQPG